MQDKYTVSDLVADFIPQCGVSTAFGVISVHNIPILDAVSRRNSIRFVPTRGEMGGGHMADAFSRVSGHLGVLVTSTGPGAANAVSALLEASFANSPVLHITGQTPTRFLDRGMGTVHEVADQSGMLAAVCKSVYRIRNPNDAFAILKRAATDAISTPGGPVSVEIPYDLQRAEIERPAGLDRFVLRKPAPMPPSADDIEALVDMVASARRPMLWLGSGARHAREPAQRLLDLGFGMVTSWDGRGTVPEDHPQNLGGLNGIGSELVETFYRSVDLMLVVGSRLRGHETSEFTLRLPDRLIQIDVDPSADGCAYPNQLFVQGDGAAALTALAEALAQRNAIEPGFADEVRTLKRDAKAAYLETLGPYASFPQQLREAMPDDAIWVRDITLGHTTWGHRSFDVKSPDSSIYPVGAAIGPGLHLGIGAALGGGGRKVVAMCGDGGFMLNATELWTAAQENADLAILVMNDKGYGVIRHIQDALCDGRRVYGDIAGPDFEKLAELVGIPFWRVSDADDFGPTMAEALAVPGTKLIEVDMNAVGDFPPYHPYDKLAKKSQG